MSMGCRQDIYLCATLLLCAATAVWWRFECFPSVEGARVHGRRAKEARRKCASVHATSSRQASRLKLSFSTAMAATFTLSTTVISCAYLGSHRHQDTNVNGIIITPYCGPDIDGKCCCWAMFIKYICPSRRVFGDHHSFLQDRCSVPCVMKIMATVESPLALRLRRSAVFTCQVSFVDASVHKISLLDIVANGTQEPRNTRYLGVHASSCWTVRITFDSCLRASVFGAHRSLVTIDAMHRVPSAFITASVVHWHPRP